MTNFFLRPVDLGALVLLFVAILVLWRLLRLHPLTEAGRYLALFYGAVLLMVLLWLAAGTRVDSWNYYALQTWGIAWSVASLALVQHIYRLGNLDNDGTKARRALGVHLVGLAIVIAWAGYQILQFVQHKPPSLSTYPVVIVNLFHYSWALALVLRQAYYNWRLTHAWAVTAQLLPLFIGVVLILIPGFGSLWLQLQGILPTPSNFVTVFIIGVAINLIGFNYLLYRDSIQFHATRFMSATLLILQTIFTFVGMVYTLQFDAGSPTVVPNATESSVYAPLAQEELEHRQTLDQWTRPIFALEIVGCLLTIGLMMAAGTPVRILDGYVLNKSLSERQAEIIVLVSKGLNNQEIALQLMISENTVKYHLKSIYDTLNVPNREALSLWYRQKWSVEPTTQ